MRKDVLMSIVSACLLGMIAVYGGYETSRISAVAMVLAEAGLIVGGFVSAIALAREGER